MQQPCARLPGEGYQVGDAAHDCGTRKAEARQRDLVRGEAQTAASPRNLAVMGNHDVWRPATPIERGQEIQQRQFSSAHNIAMIGNDQHRSALVHDVHARATKPFKRPTSVPQSMTTLTTGTNHQPRR